MNTTARRYIGTQPARRPGPTMHPEYRPPRWLEAGGLETCSGIVIGGAIAPALPTMPADGERIQVALLEHAATERLRTLVDAFDTGQQRARLPIALLLWFGAIVAGTAALVSQIYPSL